MLLRAEIKKRMGFGRPIRWEKRLLWNYLVGPVLLFVGPTLLAAGPLELFLCPWWCQLHFLPLQVDEVPSARAMLETAAVKIIAKPSAIIFFIFSLLD